MNLILLFVAISFVLVVFDLHRFAFVFELMLLLIFMFLLAFAMFAIYHNKKWGWTILGATLVLVIADTLFIFLLTGAFETAHITTIFFSVLGLIVALLNLKGTVRESEKSGIEEFEKAKDYYPYIDKMEPEEQLWKESKELLKQEIKDEIRKELKDGEAAPKAEETVKTELEIKPKIIIAMPKFVGSKETNKYHAFKCGWVRLMKRKNRVYFNTKKKAEKEGFEPHKCIS